MKAKLQTTINSINFPVLLEDSRNYLVKKGVSVESPTLPVIINFSHQNHIYNEEIFIIMAKDTDEGPAVSITSNATGVGTREALNSLIEEQAEEIVKTFLDFLDSSLHLDEYEKGYDDFSELVSPAEPGDSNYMAGWSDHEDIIKEASENAEQEEPCKE